MPESSEQETLNQAAETRQVKQEAGTTNSENVSTTIPSVETAREVEPVIENSIPINAVRIKNEPVQHEAESAENVVTATATIDVTTNNKTVNVKQGAASNATTTTTTSTTSDAIIADNFFNDLIDDASESTENVTVAESVSQANTVNSTENAPSVTETRINVKQERAQGSEVAVREESTNTTRDVNINDDFFSDLIDEPPAPPPLETLPVEELEEKFADRLRELQALEQEKNTTNENQATDKAQKRQLPPNNEENVAEKRPRVGQIRVASAASLFVEPSTSQSTSAAAASASSVPRIIRVKSEFGLANSNENNNINSDTLECLPVIHHNSLESSSNRRSANKTTVDLSRVKYENVFNEMEDFGDGGIDMSAKLKREMALKRVAAIKELFNKHAKGINEILHTDTVRKLPSNASYLTQQYYDNRSPLHTTNNVQFKFNSLASIDSVNNKLKDWGLEPLSPVIARIARVIAFDAYVLNFKLEITEISKYLPGQIQRLNNAIDADNAVGGGSSIYINAMTQTMLIGPVFSKPPKKDTNTIPTQTEATADIMPNSLAGLIAARVKNFPFLKQLDKLNENQLLALNDFAELMQQQDIAADVYRLRECLLQIFHRSQLAPIVNQASSMYIQPQPTNPQIPNRQMFLEQQVNTDAIPPPPPSFNNAVQYGVNNRNFVPSQQQQHQQQQQQQHQRHQYAASGHHRAQQSLNAQMQHQQQNVQQQQQSSTYARNARNDPRIRQNQRGRF